MEWETEVTWKGQKAKVKQRSLTFGEANDITRKCTNTKTRAVDYVLICEMKILKSIVSAPFDITLDNVRALDEPDGDKLAKVLMGPKITQEEKGEIQAACFLPDGSRGPADTGVVSVSNDEGCVEPKQV